MHPSSEATPRQRCPMAPSLVAARLPLVSHSRVSGTVRLELTQAAVSPDKVRSAAVRQTGLSPQTWGFHQRHHPRRRCLSRLHYHYHRHWHRHRHLNQTRGLG